MSKKRIFSLLAFVLILVAIFTNPTKEEHQAAVKVKATQLVSDQLGSKENDLLAFGMQLFGNNIVDEFCDRVVFVDNYYLFSLTKIKWEGKESIVAFGAFHKIFYSGKIDEKFNEIIAVLKQL
ncbi:DUF4359 domain-containing protein [Sphingobacteriaceae bacterium WQ 2009]|uniref:DUF4359 domain-containing protein n=1 Tax=Rhinopithecimicrobium faecis TaxID=2820698 RepID=A0A8T4HFP2_9SPHI|nr:DUF4359 domain-containing protein [Sphingobacteriaceae bacterium WQ 2009]